MTDSSINKNIKTEKVRLELHAHHLPNSSGSFRGTSDPYAIVTLLSNDPKIEPQIIGKTEIIKNSLNPRWISYFDLDYSITVNTRINVGIYDAGRKGIAILMGSSTFEVGEVLGSKGNIKAKKLRKGGSLYVRITPVPILKDRLFHLKFSGSEIKNVNGILSKTSPFFALSSQIDSVNGKAWTPIYKSKHIDNNLNPNWEDFSISINRLCAGDLNQPFQFSLFHFNKNGKHIYMGSFETSVYALCKTLESSTATTDFIIKNKNKEFGTISVRSVRLENDPNITNQTQNAPITSYSTTTNSIAPIVNHPQQYAPVANHPQQYVNHVQEPVPDFSNSPQSINTFSSTDQNDNNEMSFNQSTNQIYSFDNLPCHLTSPPRRPQFIEYLSGGCELELSIAIDFTGSNGDPRKPGTLHYIHPDNTLNDYEKAITAVGNVIGRYDSDKKFPVFGFGAKYGGVINHCFQIGGGKELDGISSVLHEYRQIFRTGLTMSSPTVFSEVINAEAQAARTKQEKYLRVGQQSYRVLLILTDGAVTNVQQTINTIHAASDAPLSIVIVGIGSADFSSMKILDDFNSNVAEGRDICKFVEFSKYKDDKAGLTRETLEEIPNQLVDYFFSRGIMPMPEISGSQFSLNPSEADDYDVDLNININSEGEATWANYNGAIYDDSRYDTINDYSQPNTSIPLPSRSTAPIADVHTPISPSGVFNNHQSTNTLQTVQQHDPSNKYSSPPAPYVSQSQLSFSSSQAINSSFSSLNIGSERIKSPSHAPDSMSQTYSTQSPVNNNSIIANTGQERIFHVPLPPNARPGMRLKVQNPFTSEITIITVPEGVIPGGKFVVRG